MLNPTSRFLILALALILIGSSLANFVNTSGGTVEVTDVRFSTPDGKQQSALLYRPLTATPDNPAPGVLAIHGYINSRETQSGFAIELSRRGMVVLAIDQSGHGYSDPPAFANAFGSVNGLAYLRSLPFVDTNRIGLEGHSMGGWASRAATQLRPNDYHSIAMVGSSTTPLVFGDFSGTATDPKNIAIVYSLYDEFSEFMWQGSLPQNLPSAPKLQQLFGTDTQVEVGKLYGSVEQGTARKYYQPATTHPGDHISPEAILNTVEWLQLTLDHNTNIAPDAHIFLWKEIGTLIAFLGLVLAIFPLCKLLLSFTTSANIEPLPPSTTSSTQWWISALLTTAIPAATFFTFYNWFTSVVPGSGFWPQNVTTGIAGWALLNGLLSVVLLGAGALLAKSKLSDSVSSFGLSAPPRHIVTMLVIAVLLAIVLAAVAYLVEAIFLTDFRFWVVAFKPPSLAQWLIAAAYWPVFAFFFLTFSATLAGPLRKTQAPSLKNTLLTNSLIAVAGFACLLILQYSALFSTGTLLIDQPLLTIVGLQFLPLLIIIACVSTYCLHLTGRVYLGAFVNSLFVTLYIVAGQATHVA